jgi:hypothetical protein
MKIVVFLRTVEESNENCCVLTESKEKLKQTQQDALFEECLCMSELVFPRANSLVAFLEKIICFS